MEFSYNYRTVMQRLARPSCLQSMPFVNSQNLNGSPLEMHFKVFKNKAEVPVMAFQDTCNLMSSLQTNSEFDQNAFIEVVVPLVVDSRVKMCSGADTILKYFSQRYGRLSKVTTPKGEIYYGGCGLVLNRNYEPLLYVTKTVLWPRSHEQEEVTIHVSPRVFTDDVSVVNKSILKKGIAFYLTNTVGDWNDTHMAKIVIDNGGSIFRKPVSPTPNTDLNKDIKELLRDNISEVLHQITHDSRNL